VELKEILESIVFSAQKPMSIGELRTVLRDTPEKLPDEKHTSEFATATARAVEKALEELVVEHDNANRSYRLACVGGNWQFVTRPDFAPWLQVLVGAKPRPPKLSQPALETLAIVAYRQPITRAEMEQIRGVAVDGVVATLVERELIEIKGEAEAPGRPKLYGTTQFFLEHFGLKSLEELPAAEELRRIQVELATAAKPEDSDQSQLDFEAAPAEESQEESPAENDDKPEDEEDEFDEDDEEQYDDDDDEEENSIVDQVLAELDVVQKDQMAVAPTTSAEASSAVDVSAGEQQPAAAGGGDPAADDLDKELQKRLDNLRRT
jgi:segregation and condensation protein B